MRRRGLTIDDRRLLQVDGRTSAKSKLSNHQFRKVSWLPYIWLPIGYLVGSTPFGFIAGKLKGIDIREHGSGNIGATNVLRTLGKPIGVTVFAMDFLKGFWPVLLARLTANETGQDGLIPVFTCATTILGHNFPIWLKFKGGKGIATSGGAMLPLMPTIIFAALVLWGITFWATRYVSLASIVAAITLPAGLVVEGMFGHWRLPLLIVTATISAMAIWRHKTNIIRLMAGTENRFTRKKKRAI